MRSLANLGAIGPYEVSAELARRGLFEKEGPPLYTSLPEFPEEPPDYQEDYPDYPDAPQEPVVIIPGPADPIIQPLLPTISPDQEPWEIVEPLPIPTEPGPAISRTVMIAGVAILAAVILFYGKKGRDVGSPTARKGRMPRRPRPRAVREPVMREEPILTEEYAPADAYEEAEWTEDDHEHED